MPNMTTDEFLEKLQAHAASFAKAVATKEGEWIIKGFIDIYRRIYTISVDTKIVSKVLELLLFPMFVDFGKKHGLKIELCPQQNFYPDLTFTHERSDRRFAVDIKSTYRDSPTEVNGMTLGAFTGYFRNRDSNKNTLYPTANTQAISSLASSIPNAVTSPTNASSSRWKTCRRFPPSSKTSSSSPSQVSNRLLPPRQRQHEEHRLGDKHRAVVGNGPFAPLGEEVYDDYWMFYLTRDMAEALSVQRPYMNLKTYLEYKKRGIDVLRKHEKDIAKLAEDEPASNEGD